MHVSPAFQNSRFNQDMVFGKLLLYQVWVDTCWHKTSAVEPFGGDV